MDYFFTKEQLELQERARYVADTFIRPVSKEFDETGEFPYEIMKECAKAGLMACYIPEEYGGTVGEQGGGITELCIVTEELSKACGGISICLAANALGAFPYILFGTEEQKKKYLPRLASGEIFAAFGLTEPNAGSDAGGVRTTAVKDGDDYIINGTKQWITNGGIAKVYSIVTITDKTRGARGSTTFIVEDGMPGFKYGKKENKLGIRASVTRELIFEDCRVPASNMIGKEGRGFMVTMKTLDKSRPGVAAQALGIALGAFDLALEYAHKKQQFGKSIASIQSIQFMLADMATEIEAARALLYMVAKNMDTGVDPRELSKYSAMSKMYASDVAMKVTQKAIQIFGTQGILKDNPIEKYFRDAKITQIYEGTNQIQREVIGLALIKDLAKKIKK